MLTFTGPRSTTDDNHDDRKCVELWEENADVLQTSDVAVTLKNYYKTVTLMPIINFSFKFRRAITQKIQKNLFTLPTPLNYKEIQLKQKA